jgi:hypothetical protein
VVRNGRARSRKCDHERGHGEVASPRVHDPPGGRELYQPDPAALASEVAERGRHSSRHSTWEACRR